MYYLQHLTSEAVDLLRAFGREIDRPLCRRFEQIVAEGTGWEFDFAHNERSELHLVVDYRGQSSFAVTYGDSATCGDFCA
ncbi:MAG: hypothetical protein IT175_04575 [Acidobacteria bacterium]|nr:hypothetical protein [Acidobacteriota bacterium]